MFVCLLSFSLLNTPTGCFKILKKKLILAVHSFWSFLTTCCGCCCSFIKFFEKQTIQELFLCTTLTLFGPFVFICLTFCFYLVASGFFVAFLWRRGTILPGNIVRHQNRNVTVATKILHSGVGQVCSLKLPVKNLTPSLLFLRNSIQGRPAIVSNSQEWKSWGWWWLAWWPTP